jgi:MoaA/NifB/PqqE/SkfB family radical SAM enzyme
MPYTQDAPFAVQVEFSEGCNLYCDFCGLQGIRTQKEKNFKFMTVETAKSLASQIRDAGWNPRIEFAMHGEPTMNPDYIKLVRIFRKRLPKMQLMMTSNGGGLLRPPGVMQSLIDLFDAGLNIFAFDAYEYVKIKDKIDEVLFGDETVDFKSLPFDVHRYPDDKTVSPHSRYGPNARKFIRIQDISVAVAGTHSMLNNHTGCGSAPLKEPMQARCAKPFRELSVRWDGSVAICCNDWRGIYKCGNIVDDGMVAIWQSPEMMSARRYLMKGDRGALSPCDVCDAKSYRVGLLPDKFGKKKLREPNGDDEYVVQEATKGKPITAPVTVPWESKVSVASIKRREA